ncbi:HET-domain-containing protein [Lindgomyces ingoldianus]|uniref:HET-domain-containing protein n=1 Tax=Lindgomyces ingoldianus TaxID=673940 RepID=A0ACB6R0M0_9PLEO|nr:HET-domain-containing protein [Lindgomyces ingoldianus]KAF2472799.1 HET-domain-containing protein [Lindgomyces ingoldianus]
MPASRIRLNAAELDMPIRIRTPAPGVFAASYHYPTGKGEFDSETFPWLNPSDSSSPRLCHICSRLNFSWLYSQSLYEYNASDGSATSPLSDGIRLGLFADIAGRLFCSFCQLIVHAMKNVADIDMLNEFDEWHSRDIYIMNYAYSKSGLAISPESKKAGSKETEYAMRLGVWLKHIKDDETIMHFGRRSVMIQRVCDDSAKPIMYGGLPLALDTPSQIQTINRWIRPCLEDTRPTALTSRHDMKALRLIDTQKSCIVGPFQGERYVALSYTWGKIDPLVLKRDNEVILRQEGAFVALKEKVPTTIQDAISLCRMLGEQYLWVDSLCIMQDTVDKHDQIQQMDRIYRNAALTIVAAAGRDANAGLPGISSLRDVRQRIVDINGLRLANLLPYLSNAVVASVWETRGWTFQESALSLRKLMFTPAQVYYHCQHGDCSEDVHGDLHSSLRLAPGGSSIPMRLNIDNVSNWTIYRNIVAKYCTRELSYESDAINAFSGIAAFLSESIFAGCSLVMGIPVCSLEVGLMWQPTSRLRRRSSAMFPSWSWVGWSGSTEYSDVIDCDNLFERNISRVTWKNLSSKPEPDQNIMTCMPPETWVGWNKWTRMVDSDMDEVYYIHEDLPASRWFAHPIERRQWPTNYTNPRLQLTADVARLKITGKHADLWFKSEECEEGNHQVCRLQVFDQNNRKAGIVVMDGATFEETNFDTQPLFYFIKISQTTLTLGRDDPAWNVETKKFTGKPGEQAINPQPPFDLEEEEFDQTIYDRNICWCLYNVLVVRFDGDVAYRIAVGQVHISAFDKFVLFFCYGYRLFPDQVSSPRCSVLRSFPGSLRSDGD